MMINDLVLRLSVIDVYRRDDNIVIDTASLFIGQILNALPMINDNKWIINSVFQAEGREDSPQR